LLTGSKAYLSGAKHGVLALGAGIIYFNLYLQNHEK